MTEIDVKNLILERMAALIPNATTFDISYMAGTLKTLESLGKPDPTEKYLSSMTDAFKVMNDKKFEDSETFKKIIEGFNNQKEVSHE